MDLNKYSAFIKKLGNMYFLLLISTALLFASLLNTGLTSRDAMTMIPLMGAYYAMLSINARNKKAFWVVVLTSFIPYAVFAVSIIHLFQLRRFFLSRKIRMNLLGPEKESVKKHLNEVKIALSAEKETKEEITYFNA